MSTFTDILNHSLEDLYKYTMDCQNILFNALHQNKEINELEDDAVRKIKELRINLNTVQDFVLDIQKLIEQRVYLIQVTTTVDTNIKVLAKNEDDAIEWACETADKRIRQTLAREHDVYYDSTGEMLGHESQSDDEADEEYEYDG